MDMYVLALFLNFSAWLCSAPPKKIIINNPGPHNWYSTPPIAPLGPTTIKLLTSSMLDSPPDHRTSSACITVRGDGRRRAHFLNF